MHLQKIDLLVRAVIEDSEGRLLLCKKTGKDYFFFPGGHVEFDESAEMALKRELKEELGISIKKFCFIGASEHTFVEDQKEYHEINLVFWVVPERVIIDSKENHLKFFLLDRNQIKKEKVFPEVLVDAVLKCLRNKEIFWVSEI